MTSRNQSSIRPSSRTNSTTNQILDDPRHASSETNHWPGSHASAASSSNPSNRHVVTTAPTFPALSTDEQRQNGNAFYQKALRAGRLHGSSLRAPASALPAGRDARGQGSRGSEDRGIGSRPGRGKDAISVADIKGKRDDAIILEDNEIVKRDANGAYESFLTEGGQIYQDIMLGGEKVGEGVELEESARQREQELLNLYRTQKLQPIDLADMHAANMNYLREMTNALEDDKWMYESDDPFREHAL
ncbi:MAG: hypothetical protein M1821_009123 [Bathelium mastoideum]|nr:MAG: hypothetical protein M1821_009123 [Bathelium mastoideum]KAI9689558.1 MAG: hypothetical protein M1822_010209 [Bathelium mastoideum]